MAHGLLWNSSPTRDAVVLVRDSAEMLPSDWVDADIDRVQQWRSEVEDAAESNATLRHYRVLRKQGSNLDLGQIEVDGVVTDFEGFVVGLLVGPLLNRAYARREESDANPKAGLFRDERTVVYGRDDLIAEIQNAVGDGFAGRAVLLGESGSGKSAVLLAAEQRLREMGANVVTVLLGVAAEGRTVRGLANTVVQQLERIAGQNIALPATNTQAAFLSWWRTTFADVSARTNGLVLVVDALDELVSEDRGWGLSLVTAIPHGIGLVVSTTDPGQATALASAGALRLDVGGLPGDAAAHVAQQWAREAGRSLPQAVVAQIAAEERLPLWVRIAIDLLNDLDADDFQRLAAEADQAQALSDLLLNEVRSFPAGIGPIAELFLNRIRGRVGESVADRIVGLLAVSRSGLTPEQLVTLVSDQTDEGSYLVARACRALGTQLRQAGGGGALAFTHTAVAEAAGRQTGQAAHSLIAQMFGSQRALSEVEALDMLWHSLAIPYVEDAAEPPWVAVALNRGTPGIQLVLVEALATFREQAVEHIDSLDGDWVTDIGAKLLIDTATRSKFDRIPGQQLYHLSMATRRFFSALRGPTGMPSIFRCLVNIGDSAYQFGDLDVALLYYEKAYDNVFSRYVEGSTGSAAKELGMISERFSRLSTDIGSSDNAQHFASRAVLVHRQVHDANKNRGSARALATSLCGLGAALQSARDLDALDAYEEACSLSRVLLVQQPDAALDLETLIQGLLGVANLKWEQGDVSAARAHYDDVLLHGRRLLDARPGSIASRTSIAMALLGIARCIASRSPALALGYFDDSERWLSEAVAMAPEAPSIEPALCTVLLSGAAMSLSAGDIETAEHRYRRARELSHERVQASVDDEYMIVMLAGEDRFPSRSLTVLAQLARAQSGLGDVCLAKDDLHEAQSCYLEALDTLAEVLAEEPRHADALRVAGLAYYGLGRLKLRTGDARGAQLHARESSAIARNLLTIDPWFYDAGRSIVEAELLYSSASLLLGDDAAAAAAFADAQQALTRIGGDHSGSLAPGAIEAMQGTLAILPRATLRYSPATAPPDTTAGSERGTSTSSSDRWRPDDAALPPAGLLTKPAPEEVPSRRNSDIGRATTLMGANAIVWAIYGLLATVLARLVGTFGADFFSPLGVLTIIPLPVYVLVFAAIGVLVVTPIEFIKERRTKQTVELHAEDDADGQEPV